MKKGQGARGISKVKPLPAGGIGGLALLAFYMVTLTIADSFDYAVYQFVNQWAWFLPLIIGFGIQVGLYVHIKGFVNDEKNQARASLAVSSGISSGSMIACCIHHLADVLPIMGMSFAAVFFIEYQISFIILGIVSNLIGLTSMLILIKEGHYYKENSLLSFISKLDLKMLRGLVVILGAGAVLLSILMRLQNGLV